MERESLLTTGQMAEMNGVSRKTLRIYQERGLLVPEKVDAENGYHYYSLEQVARLDLIQRLQSMGLSLQRIGELLEKQDTRLLAIEAQRQALDMEAEIERMQTARSAALKLAENCILMENKPPCGILTVEWMPAKRLLYFPVEPYDYADFEDVQWDGFTHWEMALRSVKKQMRDFDVPISLFSNIGCFVEKEDLAQRHIRITGAGAHVPPDFSHEGCEYRILPAGLYLTAYCDTGVGDGSFSGEAALIFEMLDEIRAKGWQLTGGYYGDVMAETPAFHFTGRECFMRLTIGITIPQGAEETAR